MMLSPLSQPTRLATFAGSICGVLLVALLAPAPLLAQPAAPSPELPPLDGPVPLEGCEDGVVKDDGTVETGWGWVPSVIEGIYVQRFDAGEFPIRGIEDVCICFLRTREDADIDFEVVFYRDIEGQPEEEPFAAVPATLEDVPQGIIGKVMRVETPNVRVPPGNFYVGVRWDPSVDQFFFVCADTTEETPLEIVWFRDDRAKFWANVIDTPDPLFDPHRSIVVRPVGTRQVGVDVPSVGAGGLVFLAALLLGAGLFIARRR